jgi:hypothetical protein
MIGRERRHRSRCRRVVVVLATIARAMGSASPSRATVVGPNLVSNGDAEAGPTVGWTTTTGSLSRVTYGFGN